MAGRSFIDTNVLVYAFAKTEDARHQQASNLLETLLTKEGCSINVQVLKEFYVIATGKLKKRISRREAASIIRDLSHTFRVIEDTLPQLERALDIVEANKISLWDASIIAAAEAAGCDVIYTEDLSRRSVIGSIKVLNPFRRSIQ